MARAPKKQAAFDADWAPTQAVENPILNGPYEEPKAHWAYDRGGRANQVPERRKAGYYALDKQAATGDLNLFAQDEAQLDTPFDHLHLVNALRDDVRRWRASGYKGATKTTKELLAWWFERERARRMFFCQREAIETLIYVLELAMPGQLSRTGYRNFEVAPEHFTKLFAGQKAGFPSDDKPWWPRLVDVPADADLLPLRRLGCKMATGSGKTLVMAMTIAWAFCNRRQNKHSAEFPRGVLVCAPNLTVRERLQVLKPEAPGNYYDAFELVPASLRPALQQGRVHITNWHAFAPKSEHRDGDTTSRVVNKGPESHEAFARDRLRDLAGLYPLLVLNDEGHHCWRPVSDAALDEATAGLDREAKESEEREAEEARVWLAGLDRINNSGLAGKDRPAIHATIDLSATPFYLAASGQPAGSPFPWLVSDFGLMDAIESGIVKVPRLPVKDDLGKKDEAGRPDPKFFALWKHLTAKMTAADKAGRRYKPESVFREAETALTTLASAWQKQFLMDEHATNTGEPPPVLIVVCENTELARLVYEHISGERVEEYLDDDGKKQKRTVYGTGQLFPELLSNTESAQRTVRIDVKLLDQLEASEGETKDEAAKRLRAVIDSVGKRGGPGEHVRCVVSVAMLTEGWDANNVTHILGIRAFQSQLLCEQVVGRGLRRRSYEVDPETGRLPAEYVDVYGIPFSLLPFKGEAGGPPKPQRPAVRIQAVKERERLRLRAPRVEGYTYDVRDTGIRCDVDALQELVLEHEPTEVFLRVPKGYADVKDIRLEEELFEVQNRQAFHETVRMQQIEYHLAWLLTEDLVRGADGPNAAKFKNMLLARHQVFPSVRRIVGEYVATKVRPKPGVDRAELAHEKYAQRLREIVRDGILPSSGTTEAPLRPVVPRYRPWLTTDDVDYLTRRPVHYLTKSHLNAAPIHSDGGHSPIGERTVIDKLEELAEVECFTPNDKAFGLRIPYVIDSNPHHYEPDFLVKLTDGTHVLLEVKGKAGEIHSEHAVNAKSAAAEKWAKAVSNAGYAGRWSYLLCKSLFDLPEMLRARMTAPAVPEPEAAAPAVVEVPAAPEPVAAPPPARVLRFVRPTVENAYSTCVPKVSLQAAAGGFGHEQLGLELTPDEAMDWVTWEDAPRFERGMFLARVVGRSMLPDIPDGAWCLFRAIPIEAATDRPVLVRHPGLFDDDTGGQYTVKDLEVEWDENERGERVRTALVLKPRNPEFQPIRIEADDDTVDVRVIAEVVAVIPRARFA